MVPISYGMPQKPNPLKLIFFIPTAGEFMSCAEPFLEQQMHPTQIIAAYRLAMDDLVDILKNQIR